MGKKRSKKGPSTPRAARRKARKRRERIAVREKKVFQYKGYTMEKLNELPKEELIQRVVLAAFGAAALAESHHRVAAFRAGEIRLPGGAHHRLAPHVVIARQGHHPDRPGRSPDQARDDQRVLFKPAEGGLDQDAQRNHHAPRDDDGEDRALQQSKPRTADPNPPEDVAPGTETTQKKGNQHHRHVRTV